MLVIVVMALLTRGARINDDPLTQKAFGDAERNLGSIV